MRARHFVIALASLFTLGGCGAAFMPEGNLTGNLQSTRNSFSYEFEYNGCNTGRQKFGSKDAMCEGLKSQSRNNYCAVSMRERFFEQQGCPGIFELEK